MNEAAALERFIVSPSKLEGLGRYGFTTEELHRIVAPRRTLARRKALNQSLSLEESDKVLRLERISQTAERVFGDSAKAQRWMRKPNRALEGATPIDLLQSETGAHLVEQSLLQIDHGIFA